MVVGLGKYQDINEAYPLDKKTLNKIALRSLFANVSFNGESLSSIGWLWAIEPGLKKIHTNEEDLALSRGHNLELVSAQSMLSPLAMGVVLALEQQKAELETIRGARTMASSLADGLGLGIWRFMIIPLACALAIPFAQNGALWFVLVVALVAFILNLLCRILSLRYGYAKAMRAIEGLQKHKEGLMKAVRGAGVVCLGALVIALTMAVAPSLNGITASSATTVDWNLNRILPGILPLCILWLVYTLLQKNWSMGKLFALLLAISLCLGLIGNLF